MLDILYVVISLIILEGLLSFDNALVLAAMVQPLPDRQQKWALRVGIIGAYVMRGLSILCISYLIENPWLKPVGAAWLLYLAFKNLGSDGDDDDAVAPKVASFFWTVVAVEMADMAFSIDNIFAAAAFSPNRWAVLTGVAIGILAMRFVAGIFVDLIKKFPVLEKIGYVLVGYIGVTLAVEYGIGQSLPETAKFFGVVGIMAFGIAWERIGFLNRLLTPVFVGASRLMGWVATPVDAIVGYVGAAFGALNGIGKTILLLTIAICGKAAWSYLTGDALQISTVCLSVQEQLSIGLGSLAATALAFAFLRSTKEKATALNRS
jgi:tellurite resistance protein TerC